MSCALGEHESSVLVRAFAVNRVQISGFVWDGAEVSVAIVDIEVRERMEITDGHHPLTWSRWHSVQGSSAGGILLAVTLV